MTRIPVAPLRLRVDIETWPLRGPFRIAGHEFRQIQVALVTLEHEGHRGRGEATGVYYRHETAESIAQQLASLRPVIESGLSRDSLPTLLPPGGARNAIDCALWELEAKLNGCSVWQLAGLSEPKPLLTMLTCGADTPENMAAAARAYEGARVLKVKLTGEDCDTERVRAIRRACSDVEITVDANQAFTLSALEQLMPTLIENRVTMIEQPLPIGQEALLQGFNSPIPIAADESVQCSADIPGLAGRFDVVNIKLDKCGGLTEALSMARAARSLGLKTWIGNMIGTSLAMAPAFIAGQVCDFVELDGPIFLENDRPARLSYFDGTVVAPAELWGGVGKEPLA